MKKSRNIKNLRDFLKIEFNCYLDKYSNHPIAQKILQVVEFKQYFLDEDLSLCRYPISFTL